MSMRRHRFAFAAAVLLLLVSSSFGVVGAAQEAKSDKKLAMQSELILGLDGNAYLPYKDSVVEWVQRELQTRDLYDGTISGELDERTKQAIAEFQKQNSVLPTGIPSPRTRDALGGDEDGDQAAGAGSTAMPIG
jgi:peptidoglycan hydrolase-like protein with peptidoglycan-binding domain